MRVGSQVIWPHATHSRTAGDDSQEYVKRNFPTLQAIPLVTFPGQFIPRGFSYVMKVPNNANGMKLISKFCVPT